MKALIIVIFVIAILAARMLAKGLSGGGTFIKEVYRESAQIAQTVEERRGKIDSLKVAPESIKSNLSSDTSVLSDEKLNAISRTSFATFQMEVENITGRGGPVGRMFVYNSDQLHGMEAYLIGLVEGFTVALLKNDGEAIVNDPRIDYKNNRMVHNNVTAAFLKMIGDTDFYMEIAVNYENVGVASGYPLAPWVLERALKSKLTHAKYFSAGRADAHYQASIAHSGFLEPTKRFRALFDEDNGSYMDQILARAKNTIERMG